MSKRLMIVVWLACLLLRPQKLEPRSHQSGCWYPLRNVVAGLQWPKRLRRAGSQTSNPYPVANLT